jgi:hypothetical protein
VCYQEVAYAIIIIIMPVVFITVSIYGRFMFYVRQSPTDTGVRSGEAVTVCINTGSIGRGRWPKPAAFGFILYLYSGAGVRMFTWFYPVLYYSAVLILYTWLIQMFPRPLVSDMYNICMCNTINAGTTCIHSWVLQHTVQHATRCADVCQWLGITDTDYGNGSVE